jgi:high-affinity K+ transport system ATPase subunit B
MELIQQWPERSPAALQTDVDSIARAGGTPLVVARNGEAWA